jgi:hypothetical protein
MKDRKMILNHGYRRAITSLLVVSGGLAVLSTAACDGTRTGPGVASAAPSQAATTNLWKFVASIESDLPPTIEKAEKRINGKLVQTTPNRFESDASVTLADGVASKFLFTVTPVDRAWKMFSFSFKGVSKCIRREEALKEVPDLKSTGFEAIDSAEHAYESFETTRPWGRLGVSIRVADGCLNGVWLSAPA